MKSNNKNMRLLINSAIEKFNYTDKQLLGINETEMKVHEIAIAHRLAVYIEHFLNDSNMSVDLEYNKHGEDPKKYMGEVIRPDIVVHIRGNDNNNLAAIEVKKSEHSQKAKTEAIQKIKGLCGSNFKYRHGFVIEASNDKLKVIFDIDEADC